jgi:hypothetical protein
LILSAAQFVSDAEEGFKSFSGPLPGNLKFTDLKADAVKKLGTPDDEDDDLRLAIWKLGELMLAIDFALLEPHPVGVVTVQVPAK